MFCLVVYVDEHTSNMQNEVLLYATSTNLAPARAPEKYKEYAPFWS